VLLLHDPIVFGLQPARNLPGFFHGGQMRDMLCLSRIALEGNLRDAAEQFRAKSDPSSQ
jgi:hypothetical protein